MPTKIEPAGDTEEIFCSSIVRFYNQPIGLIVAETIELANQASKSVKIDYHATGNANALKMLLLMI